MNEIKMVKYTAEQIDQVLLLLASIAGDSKSYECSLPMMSVILDINNYLRDNAIIFDEVYDGTEQEEENFELDDDSDDEIILDGNDDDE